MRDLTGLPKHLIRLIERRDECVRRMKSKAAKQDRRYYEYLRTEAAALSGRIKNELTLMCHLIEKGESDK